MLKGKICCIWLRWVIVCGVFSSVELPMWVSAQMKGGSLSNDDETECIHNLETLNATEMLNLIELNKCAAKLQNSHSQRGVTVLLAKLTSFGFAFSGGPEMLPVVGEFPCAVALMRIGEPALALVVKDIQSSSDPKRLVILLYIVKGITGDDVLRQMVQDRKFSNKNGPDGPEREFAYSLIDDRLAADSYVRKPQ